MKTWTDYKNYVSEIDSDTAKELAEIEENTKIISAMIQRRNELGLSQRDLAAICGIPQSSVARIEAQSSVPKLDTLLKIFNKLGLTFSVQAKSMATSK